MKVEIDFLFNLLNITVFLTKYYTVRNFSKRFTKNMVKNWFRKLALKDVYNILSTFFSQFKCAKNFEIYFTVVWYGET